MKLKAKKIAIVATVCLAAFTTANAQVTIGSNDAPNPNALLELTEGARTSRGLLLPRVKLTSTADPAPLTAHVQGMHVYNTDTAGTAQTSVRPGEYYNDGTKWVRVNSPSWFYAPSMVFESTNGTYIIDLWQRYHEYFDGNAAGNLPHNPSAYPFPKRTFAAGDLNYYVTGYDATVFRIDGITDNGVLTYTVLDERNVTDATFINIVFVVK